MNFTISFQDLINAIKKAIEEHPGITVAAATSMVVGVYFAASPVAAATASLGVGGYLVYRAAQPKMESTGGCPKTNIREYKQLDPLEGIDKTPEYTKRLSEDNLREAVTVNLDSIPTSDKGTIYNCWSWAINPISGLLTSCNPPNINDGQEYTIDQMKTATVKYLNAMKKQTKLIGYSEAKTDEEVKKFIAEAGDKNRNKLVIGLRVSEDLSCFNPLHKWDYHYIRWYLGQWSAKGGESGIVVKNFGPSTTDIEPETMWFATLINQEEERVRLARSDRGKGEVLKNPIYKGPTTYYLITIK